VIVDTPVADAELGEDWADSPAIFTTAASVPVDVGEAGDGDVESESVPGGPPAANASELGGDGDAEEETEASQAEAAAESEIAPRKRGRPKKFPE
jgi:hypothetical protein